MSWFYRFIFPAAATTVMGWQSNNRYKIFTVFYLYLLCLFAILSNHKHNSHLYSNCGNCPALTSVPLLDFFELLNLNTTLLKQIGFNYFNALLNETISVTFPFIVKYLMQNTSFIRTIFNCINHNSFNCFFGHPISLTGLRL